MVNASVTDAFFLHTADNALESLQILAGISVQLHIADMTRVCKGVIGGFQMDFLIGPDGEIYRNMEGIGVILSIRYAGYRLLHLYLYIAYFLEKNKVQAEESQIFLSFPRDWFLTFSDRMQAENKPLRCNAAERHFVYPPGKNTIEILQAIFEYYSLTVFLRTIVRTKSPVTETAAKATGRRFSASPVVGGPRGVSSSGF